MAKGCLLYTSADHRRDGHSAQGGRGRILHRVERQRLHAPGQPYPRIGPGGAGVRREEDAEAVHQVLRQIHLRRNPRADAAGEGGPCEEKGGREKIRRGRSACGAGRRNCRGKETVAGCGARLDEMCIRDRI